MSSFPSVHDAAAQNTSSLSPRSNASPAVPTTPSNIDIEAVIQAATSSSNAQAPARDTRTQLFVGNLPWKVRWQDLKDLFRRAGTVLRADVSLGPDSRSRGYGAVLLASAEDAAKAIEMYNGYSWHARTLEVRADRIPPDLDLSNPMNTLTFPKGHSSNMHPVPFIPPINGAFVQYQDPALAMLQAKMAESQSNLGLPAPPPMGMRSTSLSPQLNISSNAQGRNLFVGNLPFQCQWQDLKDLFRSAGQIVRADVALGADGRSRGFGTVLFANDADANTAVAMFNGYEYNGRTLKVHHDRFTQFESPQLPSANHQYPGSPGSPHLMHPTHLPPMIQSPLPPYSQPTMLQSPYFGYGSQPGTPFNQYLPHLGGPQNITGFTATPGQHPLHPHQHHQYLQHLQETIATPPTLQAPPTRAAMVGSNTALDETCSARGSEGQSHVAPGAVSSNAAGPASAAPGAERPASQSNPQSSKFSASSTSRAPPGTLSLPTQTFTVPNPMSPRLTRGLHPVTPSMPAFTFHAPPAPTPPVAPHFLSPGLGPFSPPITFFNPLLNPAPGAPLHQQPSVAHPSYNGLAHQGFGIPTPQPRLSPQYFNAPGTPQMGINDHGYFPPVLTGPEPQDYFAGVTDTTSLRQVSRESVTTSSQSGRTLLSSGDSSPQHTGDTMLSSRGTSILAEGDEGLKPSPNSMGLSDFERFSISTAGDTHRAKSSSSADADPTRIPDAVKHTPATELLRNGDSQRRASWTDLGGLRRTVAGMSLGDTK